MKELRPLRLPQMVEARRKRESLNNGMESPDSSIGGYSWQLSRSPTSSETQSPVTPNFSVRGHAYYTNSSPLLASSPTMRESFDGFGAAKRPLTEVEEEPLEREEDPATPEQWNHPYRNFAYDNVRAARKHDEHGHGGSPCPADYDWVDSFMYDGSNIDFDSCSKRQRGDKASLPGISSRISSRFPSLSRKWKNRGEDKTFSIITDSFHDVISTRSRANSTRAPSLMESIIDTSEKRDAQIPLSPARSVREGSYDGGPASPMDVQKANATTADPDPVPEPIATTPLLPPIMTDFPSRKPAEPIQSPLQSPKIAESPTTFHSPVMSPRVTGLPSPPLSTRPSVSSFHHRPLPQVADIPPMLLADPHDEWANKLGHANFTISPEPYVPDVADVATGHQHRADWETARCNYMKHLARTGEHYSTTSKVHQLTEEKWAQIDAQWKQNNELLLSRLVEQRDDSIPSAKPIPATSELAPLSKIPSLNGPKSDGKFPKVGDEGIVGPMTREKAIVQPRPSRKRAFWKFLQGVLPSSVALGR